MGRILALDFGLKRTGIAITDEMNIIASGLKTVDSKFLMDELKSLVSKNNISTIVLGEPKRLNGSDSHISENVRLLFEHLKKLFPLVSVVKYDERFTSKMASQSIAMMGLSKSKKQDKSLIDEVSATIILQSYMQSVGI
ncbi:MAG: Holliday junction resolvase RuvX [Crocinitomicaceae bacterium]|jgi:putative Holliday junction resolvase